MPSLNGVGGPAGCKEAAKRCTELNRTVGPTLIDGVVGGPAESPLQKAGEAGVPTGRPVGPTLMKELELENSTFKPALMLMTGRVFGFAATFFVPVVLTRVFTPAEFGTYKQFFLLVSMLYGIGQAGMAESLYYFLPSSRSGAGRFATNSALTLAVIGCVLCVGLFIGAPQVASAIGNARLEPYIGLAGSYLMLMLMSCVLEIVWISRKRYRHATVSYAISDTTRAALLIAPALLFRSLDAVIWGGLLFCMARAAAMLMAVRHEFPHELKPDAILWKRQLTYAIPFALAVVVDIVQANYHQLAISSRFDAATYAIYAIGCLQIPLVDFMSTPASSVMMVRMGEEIRDGRRESVLSIWHDTTRKLALVFFPLVGMLAVNAHALITLLFTDRYAASIPVFTVWSLSILFAAIQTDGVMRVFAQTRFLFIVNLLRLVLLVAVMQWFLTHFQLIGAVCVTLIGSLFAKTMALARMKRLMKTGVSTLMPWDNLGRILLATMISALPVALMNASVSVRPSVMLATGASVYGLTYVCLVLLFRILTSAERQTIVSWLMRRVGIGGTRCAE